MATIRPGIWEKVRNFNYDIPVPYKQPFVYIGLPFTLYWTGWLIQWISSLGILFSLLAGLGNGDVGNNNLCAWKHLYIV